MFNPFHLFEHRLINAFRKTKERYLVTQTFTRIPSSLMQADKVYLLLSQYDNYGHAAIHLNAVSKDKWAYILDLENEKHRAKLIEMLDPQSKYILYSSLMQRPSDVEDELNKLYNKQLEKYLKRNTHWRISSSATIVPHLEITFGELFVAIKFGSQKIRPKLVDIENAK